MGVHLDWEIESDQAHVRNEGEDPGEIRRRRSARTRILLFILFLFLLLGGAAGAVVLRLREVDAQVEQLLRDTVEAEVAALRIGDRATFMASQRSATDDWILVQGRTFDYYEALKTDFDARLTGRIADLEIEGTRARVLVEEIIDGVPYGRIWYYWRYADGWRHVPPDFTFWGEQATIEQPGVTVAYRSVDAALAAAVAADITRWREEGCAVLPNCQTLPVISVEVLPVENALINWSPANPWLLQIPSPYTDRARLDQPFDPEMRSETARLIAERLVGQATEQQTFDPQTDAGAIVESVVYWLTGKFSETRYPVHLTESLATRYGEPAVGRVLELLTPASSLTVLNEALGTGSLLQAELDWREFVTWRLNRENTLRSQADQALYRTLYDETDPTVVSIALSRYNANLPVETFTVNTTRIDVDGAGNAALVAIVAYGDPVTREETIFFRLVDGAWRRAN